MHTTKNVTIVMCCSLSDSEDDEEVEAVMQGAGPLNVVAVTC